MTLSKQIKKAHLKIPDTTVKTHATRGPYDRSGGMNAIPPLPAVARALTCARSCSRTSLSLQRAGTGRYAGLKVPTVCAHSPAPGLMYGSAEAAAAAAAPASADPRAPRGEMGDVPRGKSAVEDVVVVEEVLVEDAADALAAAASAPPA